MFKFTSSAIAGVATLALASVPALAVATGAQAAPVSVKVSDLNIASARDAHALEQRVGSAVGQFCDAKAGRIDLADRQACKTAVRLEIQEQLSARQTARAAAAVELAQR